MLKITEYLTSDLVQTGIKPKDKKHVCEIMVDMLIEKGKISADRKQILMEKLLEREALSSTGIGQGVAIPHASGENIDNMLVAVGQVPEGVEFESIDGAPVNLVFMIIGSERSAREHLQLLAAIVRACKNHCLVEKLLVSASANEVYGHIKDFCKG
ncbi:hypothetical protein MNBD_NITROSPINAE02-2008 [hydrothermal vent metagenome]|uniref:PTS EIIA type-2 domain-containing protein n=1 Tax=hydrothermal vent metagenome TaxID=652676 RepID=A0A3B1C8X6_9ZZZZ